MTDATVTHLFTTDTMSQPMTPHDSLTALAGEGIEGDRYLLKTGTYSKKPEPGRQLTLTESEVLDWLQREHGVTVTPEQCRRNVVTTGIRLAPLVGREVMVGPVRLKVHRISQPCRYIEKLLDRPGLYDAWWDKGGVNCEILVGGPIRIGDTVVPVDAAEAAE